MPKKQPKNAYFFFMLEFKRFQEANGSYFPGGMKDVAKAASEPWKKITPRDKDRYERMAKAAKDQDRKFGERYTSQGKALSELAREEEEKKRKIDDQKRSVVKLVDDAVQNDNLIKNPFYIVSFNYFTKEIMNSKYYPAEIGIVRFCVKDGITKKFHCLINPGKLPLGHAFTAKDHGEKTHKLQLPPDALGETEYELVLGQMIEFFVQERSSSSKAFPILVMESEMEMVESIMREFCQRGELDFDTVKILPLTFFFQKIVETVDKVFREEESKFTYAIAEAHLERDTYDFHQGNGCRIHEMYDVNPHCALSRPTRWAYYIIDQAIGITGGRKKPGFHFPKGCTIEGASDDESEEEEKYSKKEEDDRFTEDQFTGSVSGIKVFKNEFSEDETRVETDTMSMVSTKFESLRNPKDEYDTDTTATFDMRESSYAHPMAKKRSLNPFHEDNFPPLGATATKVGPNPFSYRRFDVDSDTSDQSHDRQKQKDRYRKHSRHAAGSSRDFNTQNASKCDPNRYLREKYEKLKVELALLDRHRRKRNNSNVKRERSRSRDDDDVNERSRFQRRREDSEVFQY